MCGRARVARGVRTTRARDAKPRTAPMARRRDGDIAPYRQAARGEHTGSAPYRHAARGESTGGARGMPSRTPRWRAATGNGAAARAGRPGGRPSRPTAMPHERCARPRGARGGTTRGHERRGRRRARQWVLVRGRGAMMLTGKGNPRPEKKLLPHFFGVCSQRMSRSNPSHTEKDQNKAIFILTRACG